MTLAASPRVPSVRDQRLLDAGSRIVSHAMRSPWRLPKEDAEELAHNMVAKAQALAQTFHKKGELARITRHAQRGRAQARKLSKFLRDNATWLAETARLGPISELRGRNEKARIETLAVLVDALADSLGPRDIIKPCADHPGSGEVIVKSVVATLSLVHGHRVGRPESARTIATKHLVGVWLFWFRDRQLNDPDISWTAIALLVAAVTNVRFSNDLARSLSKVAAKVSFADIPLVDRPKKHSAKTRQKSPN